MSTTDEQRLREALTACRRELLQVLVSVNDEKVHFDGDDFHEALRLAENALAQQAPTPAALPDPVAREAEAPAELTDDMMRYAMGAVGSGSPKDADKFRLFWRFAMEAKRTEPYRLPAES